MIVGSMSGGGGSGRGRGPPKHQNRFAWKADAGRKINETEVGGKFRPYSEITGVCVRCRLQIEWKRKYGKYKRLTEPAKCNQCGKRAVRQAYHMLCSACAKERGVCAKCCNVVENIVGRDMEETEVERKQLEEAIKDSRERDRRTLLRVMNTNKQRATLESFKNSRKNKFENNHSSPSESNEDESNEGSGHIGEDVKIKSKNIENIAELQGAFDIDVLE